MKLKKNRGTKLAAILASFAALGGVWALVHQNPPANADTASTEAPAATATRVPAVGSSNRRAAAPTPQVAQPATKKHTRTRAS